MKFVSCLVIFFVVLFHCTNGSKSNDLIPQSCKEASKSDPNLKYHFCVASLEEASSKSHHHSPPTNLEDLVGLSIQQTKSNVTNLVSIVSNLLKNKTFDQYTKACLKDCFDLYSDSLSALDDALVAFMSKDFATANINLSSTLDNSFTCEDQFKDKKGETSPLTNENNSYFQLNVISLAFIQMFRQHH